MWIKKSPFPSKGKRSLVVFDEFLLGEEEGRTGKSALRAKWNLNCDLGDGSIRTGLGITQFALHGNTVPVDYADIIALYCIDHSPSLDFRQKADTLYCMRANEYAYKYNESTKAFTQAFQASKGSKALALASMGLDWRAFVSKEDGYYLANGNTWSYTSFPDMTVAACVCKGRTFVGAKVQQIWYSKGDKPWEFESVDGQSGKIYLPEKFGEVVALLTYREKVFVFQEYGVLELEVTGSPNDFKISVLPYTGKRILGNSVGICQNAILFLAEDGVYRFSGSTFERVCKHLKIFPKKGSVDCNYAVCGDWYILRYLLANGSYRSIAVDGKGKSGYFITDRAGLSQADGKALCVSNGYIYEICENGALESSQKYTFTSVRVDFGTRKRKHLKRVCLEGIGAGVFYSYCDGVELREPFTFVEGVTEVKIGQYGKEFCFSFQLLNDSVIRKMTAEIVTAE